jgi:hypothetical protein
MLVFMNRFQLTDWNMGRVFNYRSGHVHTVQLLCYGGKTAQLAIETPTQTTFSVLSCQLSLSPQYNTSPMMCSKYKILCIINLFIRAGLVKCDSKD